MQFEMPVQPLVITGHRKALFDHNLWPGFTFRWAYLKQVTSSHLSDFLAFKGSVLNLEPFQSGHLVVSSVVCIPLEFEFRIVDLFRKIKTRKGEVELTSNCETTEDSNEHIRLSSRNL